MEKYREGWKLELRHCGSRENIWQSARRGAVVPHEGVSSNREVCQGGTGHVKCALGVAGDGFKVDLELLWALAVNRLFFAMVMDRLTEEVR